MLSRRGIDADIDIVGAPSPGKGTHIFILAEFENIPHDSTLSARLVNVLRKWQTRHVVHF
jgi:hypothetical protein